jgi:PAS domain S-box-containing protein
MNEAPERIEIPRSDGFEAAVASTQSMVGESDDHSSPSIRPLQESEEKYRRLVEMSPDAVYVTDENHIISFINPAGLRILGATHSSQIVGRSSLEFGHFQYNAAGLDRVKIATKHGETGPTLEEKLIRIDGSEVEVEMTAAPFSEGGKSWMQVLFRDITKRKQERAKLRASEASLDAVIEHSPHSMWISDADGTLIRMNQACRDMLHVTDEGLVGKYNVLQDNIVEAQGLMPLVRRVFENREKVQFLIHYDTAQLHSLRPNITTTLVLETTISPILDSQNRLLHAVIQHIDITERKRTEEALHYRRDLAQLITDISSRFISLGPGEVNSVITNALRELGMFMGADRCYLFFVREDGRKADVTHEWCAGNTRSDMLLFQNLDLKDFAPFTEPLLHSRVVYIPRMADIPANIPNHTAWERVADALGAIQSLLLVPIEHGKNIVGCLGLDTIHQEKSWPADIAALLSVVGEVFANALDRKRAAEAQRESEQFLRQVIENAPFGAHFYRLENDGSLIFENANKAGDHILQIDHKRLIGKSIEAAFPGLVETAIPSIYREIARSGVSHSQEQVDYDEGGIKGAFEISAFQTIPGRMAVFFTDITKRKKVERALAQEASRRRILFEQSPDGIVIMDPQTMRFPDFNTAAYRQLGYSREEFAGLSMVDVEASESLSETRATISRVTREGPLTFETLHRTKKGAIRNVHVTAQTIDVLGHSIYQAIWRDITDQRQAEDERNKLHAQLVQAQKMESIGRLAGGVAHDFNNMLGVIIGHSELALEQFSAEQPVRADLEEIRKAAQRSAELTRQLLAFARKQAAVPRLLNLDASITGMLKMLRRLIGEGIELVWIPEESLDAIKMDPAQLDQIVANLCINSRDAIDGVGRITIRALNATVVGKHQPVEMEIPSGQYVHLILSDTGCGMSKEALDHLFEPFYTTKELGRGTGLGLATVYGIVKQNESFIHVTSELGKGTEFHIYFPSAAAKSEEAAAASVSNSWRSNGETVLLVEDEKAILNLGKAMLGRMGFSVLTAGSPGEAIRLAVEYRGKIDLLVTDVIMPEMNGRDLAVQIRLSNPGLKCLFMSGYTADVIAHSGVLDEGVNFLQKPFSAKDLSEKVRALLDLKSER